MALNDEVLKKPRDAEHMARTLRKFGTKLNNVSDYVSSWRGQRQPEVLDWPVMTYVRLRTDC